MDQRHQHQQHRDDVEQEFKPRRRALDDRIHGGGRVQVGVLRQPRIAGCATGFHVTRFRHHDQADQDRGGCAQHGSNDEMPRGVRNQRRQQCRIKHQHRAGDARHAPGHHQEQLAAGELRQVGTNEQRRFHHAEENIGGGGEPDRAADSERAFERDGQATHDRRQDAPVEKECGQYAHHEHDRQRLERQNEFGARRFQFEWQCTAAEIAEYEGGARARGGSDRTHGVVDRAEHPRRARQFDQHGGRRKRDRKSDRRLPQRNGPAIFAQCPGEREQHHDAERRL